MEDSESEDSGDDMPDQSIRDCWNFSSVLIDVLMVAEYSAVVVSGERRQTD
jgi:hypothetical protein